MKKLTTVFLLVFLTATDSEPARAAARINGSQDTIPRMKLTVLYDNTTQNKSLREDWGLSVLVEIYGHLILFDSGGNSDILLGNMKTLGIDPRSIQQVVLSHEHPDHVNGLRGFLRVASRPSVYLPGSFSYETKAGIAKHTNVMEVTGPAQLLPGVWLVDVPVPPAIGRSMRVTTEQVLVVSIDEGLLVLAGCSHPTIDRIVRSVSSVTNRPVRVVVGGLHIKNNAEAQRVTQELKRLGVRKVMPLHCTGDDAAGSLRRAYSTRCLPGGAGRVLLVPLLSPSDLRPKAKKAA